MSRSRRGLLPVLLGMTLGTAGIARASEPIDFSVHAAAILDAADAEPIPAGDTLDEPVDGDLPVIDDPSLGEDFPPGPLPDGWEDLIPSSGLEPTFDLPVVALSTPPASDVIVPLPVVGLGQFVCVAASGIWAGRRMLRRA